MERTIKNQLKIPWGHHSKEPRKKLDKDAEKRTKRTLRGFWFTNLVIGIRARMGAF